MQACGTASQQGRSKEQVALNRRGPRSESYGTPNCTAAGFDAKPWTLNGCK